MKSLIAWTVKNSPAMNSLLISGLIVGAISLYNLRREEFPQFELEMIVVTVPYPGASPEEVEQGICQKIEEAVRSIDWIKKQTSVAGEGSGSVVLELEADVPDVQKVLNEVRAEVDRIPSFPETAEDPEVRQISMRRAAIRVGVIQVGSETESTRWELRQIAEQVRDDLLQLPSVTQAELVAAPEYQIDIEIPEATLRRYGLTLQEVARRVRRENLELPGGKIRTDAEEVLVRGKNKRLSGAEIAQLPLITQEDGAILTVGDVAAVSDGFADTAALSRINGSPGLAIAVEAATREDLLKMTDEVKEYVAQAELPPGYQIRSWGDQSVNVRDRLDLLRRNGLQGLVLVFLTLAIFLELRLAFWVALGVPVSILGACVILWYCGATLNMLSMFAFLMALGILVDDAIVIGENVYSHRQNGKGYVQAAIDGTCEVLPSVAASVATTVIAFMPMFFVTGVMGKFFKVLPLAMIAALLVSLAEGAFILPCHLAHRPAKETLLLRVRDYAAKSPFWLRWPLAYPAVGLVWLLGHLLYPIWLLKDVFAWLNRQSTRLLDWVVEHVYDKHLRFALANPAVVGAAAIAMLLFTVGMIRAGVTPWVFFPKLDSNTIEARVIFPDGTPQRVTDDATRQLEEALHAVNKPHADQGAPLVDLVHRTVGGVSTGGFQGNADRASGSHVGNVRVELVDTTQRNVRSQQIINRWREKALAAGIPGAETVTFGAVRMGPAGADIEFKLLADATRMEELEAAVEKTKRKLENYAGVIDVSDDSRPGKWEFQLRIKDNAQALGVPLEELAETVRSSYYGAEVMRLQRGRHEVKLMVRYPPEERQTLAGFNEIRVRTADGAERPLTELAEVNVKRSYAEINRVDQMRSITISADVDTSKTNAADVVNDLKASFIPGLLAEHPQLRLRWEGQQEQSSESLASLLRGFVVALIAMYVLLTLEFRSYLQPAIIMSVIPFGVIGAVWGHALMGLPLTLFSVLGLVALTGVVVNDSIVMIDFINHRIREGLPLEEALIDASKRRVRPVFLTSATTIAGLTPILLERSFQAQIVIPMATSLSFGLLVATALVLFLVPTIYLLYGKIVGLHLNETEEEVATVAPAAAS